MAKLQHVMGREGVNQQRNEYYVTDRFVLAYDAERQEQICKSITEDTDAREEL